MNYFSQSKILKKELDSELKKHTEKFNCTHSNTSIRKRTIKGGSYQYCRQCLNCGQRVGLAISKKEVLSLGQKLSAFNDDLLQSYLLSKQSNYDAIYEKFKIKDIELAKDFGVDGKYNKERFFEIYKNHLNSEKWQKIRDKVLKRSNNICEGCMEEEATTVHHISYNDVGDELLFQLVALCKKCHDKCHST